MGTANPKCLLCVHERRLLLSILPMDPATPMTPMVHSRVLRAKKDHHQSYDKTAHVTHGMNHKPALISGQLIAGRLASSGTSSLSRSIDPAASFCDAACDAAILRTVCLRRNRSTKKILPLDSRMLQTFTDTPARPARFGQARALDVTRCGASPR